MLAVSKAPITGCPQHPGWPHSVWCKARQSAGRREPCPACSMACVSHPPWCADPCCHGAAGDVSVQLIPPPWHPAAETLGEPRRAFPQDQPRLERQGRAQAGVNGKQACKRAKLTPHAPGSWGQAVDHAGDAHQERYRSHSLPPSLSPAMRSKPGCVRWEKECGPSCALAWHGQTPSHGPAAGGRGWAASVYGCARSRAWH